VTGDNTIQRALPRTGKLWIVSPVGLSCLAFALFLLAWIFPPGLYTEVMQERNLVFFDATSMLFVLLCLGGFWLGVWLIATFRPERRVGSGGPDAWKPIKIAIPLILAVGGNAIVLSVTLIREPLMFPLLLTRQGDALKEAAGRAGALFTATTVLTGMLWWALWRRREVATQRWSAFLRTLLGLTFLSALVDCIVRVDRTSLLSLVIGTFVLVLMLRAKESGLRNRSLWWSMIRAVVLVVGLFVVISFLRGTDDSREFVAQLLGYSIASYNRLAAVLSGTLHYPYGGRGLYLAPFVSYSATLQSIIPVGGVFGWPSFLEVWSSEFLAVSSAGLSRDAIWAGAFGYLFSDLGWAAPVFLIGYGALVGGIWRSLRNGNMLGTLLYPWCAFCILFWHGTNVLLDAKFVILLLVGGCMALYEKLTTRSRRHLAQSLT